MSEPHDERPQERPRPMPRTPVVSSADLFRGGREVLIEHDGEYYRLRRTKSGKLILQK